MLSGETTWDRPKPTARGSASLSLPAVRKRRNPPHRFRLSKCPAPPQFLGPAPRRRGGFEDRCYVKEYRPWRAVDSSPFRWFIRVLHFTRAGECVGASAGGF